MWQITFNLNPLVRIFRFLDVRAENGKWGLYLIKG